MTESQALLTDLWRFGATILVLAMQAGFLLLEAGNVRSKNSINVAQKNVTDLTLCWVAFLAVGFSIAFGLPSPLWSAESSTPIIEFLFQLGFCGAAATIIAGAVAERMSFAAYAFLTVAVVVLIYPVAAWTAWGNLLITHRPAILADLGFVDFAGGTVVHALAAAVALAAVIQIGPRLGRFTDEGKVVAIAGHSPVLSMLGLTILLIGWFGFNAGALAPGTALFKQTILNTATAACFGAVIALFVGRTIDGGVFAPQRTINGILGGLVIITACGGYPTTLEAAGLGLVGGLVAILGADLVLKKLKLDDPLDVIAVHGFNGVLGTIMVAAFLPVDMLAGGSRLTQLGVQSLGAGALAVVAFAVSWVVLRFIAMFIELRVSAEDEHLGLNFTEHGASVDSQRLKRALDSKLIGTNFGGNDPLSPELTGDRIELSQEIIDDAGELAESMNALLARHEVARETISQQAQRFEHFANTTSDYLWETDVDLTLVHLSSGSQQRLQELFTDGRAPALFDVFICSSDAQAENMRRVKRQEPLLQFHAKMHISGSQDARKLDVSGVPYFDDRGRLQGYRGGATDITERQLAEQRASYLAMHDELTGLGNRRGLQQSLENKIKEADKTGDNIVVAGVDLDHFKEVNDAYGHLVGDRLLSAVAERFDTVLRAEDEIYRTGGDEFVVLLADFATQTRREDAVAWCTRIIHAMEAPFQIDDRTINIGASIGLSFFPDDTRGQSDLIRMADIAMYQAKVNGKGQVVPFDVSMDKEAKERRELESKLHDAFTNRELFMTYQPRVDVRDGKLISFEALVRWRHPTRGVLAPDKFLPAVERLKLMPELGDYVLHDACSFAASWSDSNVMVAVNISPTHLVHPEFLPSLDHAISESGLEATRLEIEITEDALISDFARTRRTLEAVRDRGISIAVDDFGRGNTSLRYLQQFPVTTLKIDQSFIRHIANDERANEIARSVVRLGHDLGLRVTAEGVEDQAQLEQLAAWECDEAQGYYFSRPVEESHANKIVRDGVSIAGDLRDQAKPTGLAS